MVGLYRGGDGFGYIPQLGPKEIYKQWSAYSLDTSDNKFIDEFTFYTCLATNDFKYENLYTGEEFESNDPSIVAGSIFKTEIAIEECLGDFYWVTQERKYTVPQDDNGAHNIRYVLEFCTFRGKTRLIRRTDLARYHNDHKVRLRSNLEEPITVNFRGTIVLPVYEKPWWRFFE